MPQVPATPASTDVPIHVRVPQPRNLYKATPSCLLLNHVVHVDDVLLLFLSHFVHVSRVPIGSSEAKEMVKRRTHKLTVWQLLSMMHS